jgi:hypothetical protein
MSEDPEIGKRKKLVELIRQVAKEVCYEVLDEHLSDYEHKQKPPEEEDVQ